MPENPVHISEFTVDHLSDLKRIADSQLGDGFLSPEELIASAQDPAQRVLVAEVVGQVAGFCHVGLLGRENMGKLDARAKGSLSEFFKNQDTVGQYMFTAVSRAATRRGVGTALAREGLRWLKERSGLQFSMAWSKDGRPELASILEREGLEHVTTITDYWVEDSLEKRYPCPVCGEPPCRCAAWVYVGVP